MACVHLVDHTLLFSQLSILLALGQCVFQPWRLLPSAAAAASFRSFGGLGLGGCVEALTTFGRAARSRVERGAEVVFSHSLFSELIFFLASLNDLLSTEKTTSLRVVVTTTLPAILFDLLRMLIAIPTEAAIRRLILVGPVVGQPRRMSSNLPRVLAAIDCIHNLIRRLAGHQWQQRINTRSG